MPFISTGNELIDPFKLLKEAGVSDAMTVADFGCGTLGHYVFPAAHLVGPSGKVYAVDILKSVLGGVESRMKLEGVANVETVWGDLERERGVRLADGSIDVGLLINNLFLSRQKEAFVKECTRMLKPGGVMVVVDWRPGMPGIGPENAVRVNSVEAMKLAMNAGLKIEREFSPGKYHYGFICKKV